MTEPPSLEGAAIASPDEVPSGSAPWQDPPEGDPSRSPTTGWAAWTAPVALIGGIVLAQLGVLIVGIPATLVFGAEAFSNNLSPGVSIADTVVQDVGFVLVAIYFAHLGARAVRSWQFGLRRPGSGWAAAVGMILALLIVFFALTVGWSAAVHPGEEKTLELLGSNDGTALLVLSAALICVVAPICEEFLFRGYIFTALRNWAGTLPAAVMTGLLFGGVHASSAPVLDLVPLAVLGFGLCLLYRYSGSLYPCMIAHSLNNSIAFASLEGWGWQLPVLIVCALAGIGLVVLVCKRVGLIAPETRLARLGA